MQKEKTTKQEVVPKFVVKHMNPRIHRKEKQQKREEVSKTDVNGKSAEISGAKHEMIHSCLTKNNHVAVC